MNTILLLLMLSAVALTAFRKGSFAQTSGGEAAIRQVLDDTQMAFDKRHITHISRNTAWVTFKMADELPVGHIINTCQFSVLEKMAGIWKIAAQTWQDYRDGKLIEVN